MRLFIGKKLFQIINCYVFLLWKFILYWSFLLLLKFLFEACFLLLHVFFWRIYLKASFLCFIDIIIRWLILFLHHKREILSEIREVLVLILHSCTVLGNFILSFYFWLMFTFSVLSWFFLEPFKFFLNRVEFSFSQFQFSCTLYFFFIL